MSLITAVLHPLQGSVPRHGESAAGEVRAPETAGFPKVRPHPRALGGKGHPQSFPCLLREHPHFPGPQHTVGQLSTASPLCLVRLHRCPPPSPVCTSAGRRCLLLLGAWHGTCSGRRRTEFMEHLVHARCSISFIFNKTWEVGQLLIQGLAIKEADIRERE